MIDELMRCRGWIEAAMEHGTGTHIFEDIVVAVIQGRMQLWSTPNACAITEIVLYPRKKVLHVFLAGGDMKEILPRIEDVAQWGASQGCTAMTMAGRKGWKRVLKNWKWTMNVMERSI